MAIKPEKNRSNMKKDTVQTTEFDCVSFETYHSKFHASVNRWNMDSVEKKFYVVAYLIEGTDQKYFFNSAFGDGKVHPKNKEGVHVKNFKGRKEAWLAYAKVLNQMRETKYKPLIDALVGFDHNQGVTLEVIL